MQQFVPEPDRDFAFVYDVVADFPDRSWGARWFCFRDEGVGRVRGPPGEGTVRSDVVVIVAERVELGLELIDGFGWVLAFQEQFQGLPKPLNFPLRGRFIGAAVLLNDAFQSEEGFEGVAAAEASRGGRKSGGVNHSVVGQSRDGFAVLGGAESESAGHGRPSDTRVGAEVQEKPGMVIDPANNFGVAAVG